jgi:hypothetical protein
MPPDQYRSHLAGRCAGVRLCGQRPGLHKSPGPNAAFPAADEEAEPRRSHMLAPSQGTRAPAVRRPTPPQLVAPAQGPQQSITLLGTRRPGPQAYATPPHPHTVMPDLFRHPPARQRPASRWTPDQACPELVEGSGVTDEPNPPEMPAFPGMTNMVVNPSHRAGCSPASLEGPYSPQNNRN